MPDTTLATTRVPVATYRVQFSGDFRFQDARLLVPYLKRLGISHLYASPILKARTRSAHGYDITDPSRLNPELGSVPEGGADADFEDLARELRAAGLSILLDVVPNHMAASPENPWWMDLLENGPASAYAGYFDIVWEPTRQESEECILLPILGAPFGTVLENQEFALRLEDRGLGLTYYSWRLPLDPATYAEVLAGLEHPALAPILEQLGRLPSRTATEWEALETRRREVPNLKRALWSAYLSHADLHGMIDDRLRRIEGAKGDPRSFDRLERLIGAQPYTLAFWRIAREKINYRRFFDVSELAGLRSEVAEVHEATHALVYDLIERGMVHGLRVDHIDGLLDPADYLQRLQARQPDLYVVVEKVLSRFATTEGVVEERLPSDWSICGTTGYDFLGMVNGLYADPQGLEALSASYKKLTGIQDGFEDVAYREKKRVMRELFPGEMAALGLHLAALAEQDRHARDLSPRGLNDALIEVTACLPVYRTYAREPQVPCRDRPLIEFALTEALRRNPAAAPPVFDFLRRVLLLDYPVSLAEDRRAEWVRFVMRWQQMSGPITAKGVEDTALYISNRLVSLNEVGGSPYPVPVDDFHRFNLERHEHWPCGLNATSTHDTKRSEDVRARINVLSEIPGEWSRLVGRWMRWNLPHKQQVNTHTAPDSNEELLVYQTLVGAWPLSKEELPEFRERVGAYLIKAAREAKVHTSWLNRDETHEKALIDFLDAVLDSSVSPRFLAEFGRLERRTSFYGAVNSLSQLLLKIASPGVPDFYQSTVVWDFSLVDPDNRRPVDFPAGVKLLEKLKRWEGEDLLPLVRELLAHWRDGAVKAYLTYRGLNFRARHAGLFVEGEYLPLEVQGQRRDHAVVFARRRRDEWAIAVAPRLVARFSAREVWPMGRRAWRDTAVILPEDAPSAWRNAITGERVAANDRRLPLDAVLLHFPVALLGAA